MPKLSQPIIEVAWRHSGEAGKIHYRAKRPDGTNRHLIARQRDALWARLTEHFHAAGGHRACKDSEMRRLLAIAVAVALTLAMTACNGRPIADQTFTLPPVTPLASTPSDSGYDQLQVKVVVRPAR